MGSDIPATDPAPTPTPTGDNNSNNNPNNNTDTNPLLDNNGEKAGVTVSSGCGLLTDGDPVVLGSLIVLLATIIVVYRKKGII